MKDEILRALSTVIDPDLNEDLVSLGMIKDVKLDGNKAQIHVELTTPACPLKGKIQADCEEALSKIQDLDYEVIMGAKVRSATHGSPILPQVKNIILVLSGKGGVGKSTVSTNLALGLARNGAKVGLLDADIYGPSIPTMMGVHENPTLDEEQKIIPIEKDGIYLMSSGFLVDEDAALIWRGPMIHKIIQQFCKDVRWPELDYLLLDLPPGTGDVQLSLSQTIPVVGALMVTTPQQVALADVNRAQSMLQSLKIPVLGIVENMSGFQAPGSHEVIHIFSSGGGEKLAKKTGSRLLGQIPIDPEVCSAGDEGSPIVVKNPESAASKAFFKTAQNVAAQISTFNHKGITSKVMTPGR